MSDVGMTNVGVIGAGAWGTALAQMLASDGRDVLLWAFEEDVVADIADNRTNSAFLPSAQLADSVTATAILAHCRPATPCWPSPRRSISAPSCRNCPTAPRDLVLCSKGIDAATGHLMNDRGANRAAGCRYRGALRPDLRA